MKTRRKPPADVTLVGCGIAGHAQLTREALEALRGARVVFASPFNGLGLPSGVTPARIEDIELNEYRAGLFRPDMYRRMARRVIEAAEMQPPVVVLQPGSAVQFDAVSELVLKMAAERRLRTRIVPGVSSVEAVLAEVGYVIRDGLQVHFASQLVACGRVLDPTLAVLIIQPGYYDTLWWMGERPSVPERFVDLARLLRRSYSAGARLALVRCRGRTRNGEVMWLKLSALPRAYPKLSPFHSIFIPPASSAPVDENFVVRQASLAYACTRFITYSESGRRKRWLSKGGVG